MEVFQVHGLLFKNGINRHTDCQEVRNYINAEQWDRSENTLSRVTKGPQTKVEVSFYSVQEEQEFGC